jgi:hypothetical protein
MLVNHPSRFGSWSAGLLNLSYLLTLTFPTWGALAAAVYMLSQHGIFSLETFRFEKN